MKQERKSKQEWEEIVEDFKNSGKTKKSYCRIKDLKYHTFKYWYYQLSGKNSHNKDKQEKSCGLARMSGEAEIGFTRLKVISSKEDLAQDNNSGCEEVKTKKQVSIKLVLRSGIKLELATSNILELIRELNYVA